MENTKTRQLIHGLILAVGLVVLIGGIITGKHGAVVVGLIVAAVNAQQWIQRNKKNDNKHRR